MNPIVLFVCHASEDKESFVRPLARSLNEHPGFKVFYDEFSLVMGDSLLVSISKGLRECDFGVVVFSPDFLRKKWTQEELAGLFARETAERKIILPVWYKVGRYLATIEDLNVSLSGPDIKPQILLNPWQSNPRRNEIGKCFPFVWCLSTYYSVTGKTDSILSH